MSESATFLAFFAGLCIAAFENQRAVRRYASDRPTPWNMAVVAVGGISMISWIAFLGFAAFSFGFKGLLLLLAISFGAPLAVSLLLPDSRAIQAVATIVLLPGWAVLWVASL